MPFATKLQATQPADLPLLPGLCATATGEDSSIASHLVHGLPGATGMSWFDCHLTRHGVDFTSFICQDQAGPDSGSDLGILHEASNLEQSQELEAHQVDFEVHENAEQRSHTRSRRSQTTSLRTRPEQPQPLNDEGYDSDHPNSSDQPNMVLLQDTIRSQQKQLSDLQARIRKLEQQRSYFREKAITFREQHACESRLSNSLMQALIQSREQRSSRDEPVTSRPSTVRFSEPARR
jgi:hypothetical protein